ncbi:MbtH family protein [Saccharopolyspora taberi]|uniref:MbtH-like domain-containing protein n=1 Tax=Saccharopolyspora taberi TaxID=60895 RepID=A0ABN3VEU6_9PSEU
MTGSENNGSENQHGETFHVVVNREEQYSIWPTFKEIPAGWTEVGKQGPKAECLDYIRQVWTDMRPKSLREAMSRGGD